QLVAIEIVNSNGSVAVKSNNLSPADASELESLLSQARSSLSADGVNLADGKDFDALGVPMNQTDMLIIAPQKRASNDLTDLVTGSERDYQELVRKQRRVRLLGLS